GAQRRAGAGHHRPPGGQGALQDGGAGAGASRTGGTVAAEMTGEHTIAEANRRQVLLWRLLARVFGAEEQPALESASVAVVGDLGLPAQLLDPSVSVDTLVQRFPELADELRGLMTGDDERDRARTAALASKLLLNLFATGQGNVSATQLAA